MSQIERRFIPITDAEIRLEQTESGKPMIEGYALKYNSLSQTMRHEKYGLFKEVLRFGAFSQAIASGDDVKFNVDHDSSTMKTLARTSAKNLRLTDELVGLKINASLPNTTVARDLKAQIEDDNVRDMSFAFSIPEESGESWRREGDIYIREILNARLFDVSAVVDPAYPTTEIGLRNQNTEVAYRSFERFMEQREEEPQEEPEVEKNEAAKEGMSVILAEAILRLVQA